MRRCGSILGVAAPALLLAILAHPVVRASADAAGSPAGGISVDRIQVSSVERPARVSDTPVSTPTAPSRDRASTKPRRLMKEGCEGAISSLAGPEARRMVPGRCIA